jgi:diaminopimelate epimerase
MNLETRGRLRFFKMTGTGNDFILIDNRQRVIDADRCGDFVRSVCRRKVSAGADGVILVENDPEVDFRWRFFNADGSEAEMCGNGARCAARFAFLTGIVEAPRMEFRTLAGVVRAELLDTKVKVRMPLPHGQRMNLAAETGGRRFTLDFINTGVPHAVCFMESEEELDSLEVERWGRALRFHPEFLPAGTNADFVWVRDPHHIAVRTYERGVEGETLACGTGCIAAVLTAASRERAESPVEVKVRSGETLTLHFREAAEGADPGSRFGEVLLEGEARVAYEADLWPETIVDGE